MEKTDKEKILGLAPWLFLVLMLVISLVMSFGMIAFTVYMVRLLW